MIKVSQQSVLTSILYSNQEQRIENMCTLKTGIHAFISALVLDVTTYAHTILRYQKPLSWKESKKRKKTKKGDRHKLSVMK